MNDRDHSLQDEFDRHYRGDGPLPNTGDDPDAAAYQVIFSTLHEEPAEDLPDDFAEQVAQRVGMGTARTFLWTNVVLLFLAVAGLGAALVLMPSSLTFFQETLTLIVQSVQTLSTYVRIDVLIAVTLVLALTVGLDRLLTEWVPLRRARKPSS